MATNPLTPERAYAILGVTPGATEDERHHVFRDKRALLEKKLGAAPTDGLKAKYRAAIDELEKALELLELSQTEHDLGGIRPVLVAESEPASPPHSPAPSAAAVTARPDPRGKHRREFRISAAIVVAVAGLSGAWIWQVQRDASRARSREQALNREAQTKAAEERASAEAKSLETRREQERQREQEKLDRSELALAFVAVETELEALDQQVARVERESSKVDSLLREATAGRRNTARYFRERKRVLDAHLAWLHEYVARNEVKLTIKTVRELAGPDLPAALAKARRAQALASKMNEELQSVRDTQVITPLMTLVDATTDDTEAGILLEQLLDDEPSYRGPAYQSAHARLESIRARLQREAQQRTEFLRRISGTWLCLKNQRYELVIDENSMILKSWLDEAGTSPVWTKVTFSIANVAIAENSDEQVLSVKVEDVWHPPGQAWIDPVLKNDVYRFSWKNGYLRWRQFVFSK